MVDSSIKDKSRPEYHTGQASYSGRMVIAIRESSGMASDMAKAKDKIKMAAIM